MNDQSDVRIRHSFPARCRCDDSSRVHGSRGLIALAALALAVVVVPATNAAQSPPYVRAYASLGSGPTGPILHDSNPLPAPSVSETVNASGTTPQGSTVSGQGSASADEFGTLRASAAIAVTALPADYPGINMDVSLGAQRADVLHITPAPGTSVSFLETMEWSGPSTIHCLVDRTTSCGITIIDQLQTGNAYTNLDNNFQYASGSPLYGVPPPSSQRTQKVLTFTLPAAISFIEFLQLSGQVSLSSGSASVSTDLSHTAHLYFDPITPGATYTTDSGHLYLTPIAPAVPEPSTALLLLATLPLIAFATRRAGQGGKVTA